MESIRGVVEHHQSRWRAFGPAGATEQDVKPTYRDGILEIRFPIDEKQAAARKISVARD
jgi:hypothetical protein